MLACTRYNRHQTHEGQYNPMTFDSTVLWFCCVTLPTRLPHARMCHIRALSWLSRWLTGMLSTVRFTRVPACACARATQYGCAPARLESLLLLP